MAESTYLKYKTDLIRKLEQIFPLDAMEERDIRGLLRISQIRKYVSGQEIIKENELNRHTYYLISGQVKVVKNGKLLAYLKRTGDIFGEMSAIDGASRSASVIAVEKTICLVLDISRLEILSRPETHLLMSTLYRELAKILSARLRTTTQDLIKAREKIEMLERKIQK